MSARDARTGRTNDRAALWKTIFRINPESVNNPRFYGAYLCGEVTPDCGQLPLAPRAYRPPYLRHHHPPQTLAVTGTASTSAT